MRSLAWILPLLIFTSCGPDRGESDSSSFGNGDEDGTGTGTGDGDADGDADAEGDGDADADGTATSEGTASDSEGDDGPGPGCGNGVVDAGEQCDDGNDDTADSCAECELAFCGDGFVQAGVEECDDANDVSTDDCLPVFCTAAKCTDGYIWEGNEDCDDGNMDDTDACPTTCETPFCGDGFPWAGMEECDDANDVEDDLCANDCSSNGIYYNATFQQNGDTAAQCNAWNAFRADLDVGFDFTRVAISGSLDMTGVECTGAEADQICDAVQSGGAVNVNCDGRTWVVGECGGVELSANTLCSCVAQAYTIRPCIGPGVWGGVKSDSCSPPTQDVQVVCQ